MIVAQRNGTCRAKIVTGLAKKIKKNGKCSNFFVFQIYELIFSGISDPVLIHSFPGSFLVNPSPGGGTTVGYIFKKHNFSLNLKISFFLNMHCSGTPLEMDLQEKTPEIDVSYLDKKSLKI